MERPELTAGPSRSSRPGVRMTPSKARSIDSRLTDIFRTVCFLATSVYCASVTGAAPKYPESWRYSLALSRPRSVRAYV